MGEMTFRRRLGFLEREDDVDGMIEDFEKAAPVSATALTLDERACTFWSRLHKDCG